MEGRLSRSLSRGVDSKTASNGSRDCDRLCTDFCLIKTSYSSDDVYAYELSRLGPSGLGGLLLWGSDLICIHILLNLGIWNQFHVHRCPLASFSHSFMSI